MPLYEFCCECGEEKEILLPFQHPEQICDCGKVMQHKMSLSSFTFKQTGNQMALDSLNSKSGGVPSKNRHKEWMQQKAFEGTQSPPKTIW